MSGSGCLNSGGETTVTMRPRRRRRRRRGREAEATGFLVGAGGEFRDRAPGNKRTAGVVRTLSSAFTCPVSCFARRCFLGDMIWSCQSDQ